MKKLSLSIFLLCVAAVAAAQKIQGDYIETRSADVYTGSCFANGEVGLVGTEAILGWRVSRGGWDGVAIDGLSVAAAVKAKATLGDPYGNPYPAKAVLIVDDKATPSQRAALTAFARHMGVACSRTSSGSSTRRFRSKWADTTRGRQRSAPAESRPSRRVG